MTGVACLTRFLLRQGVIGAGLILLPVYARGETWTTENDASAQGRIQINLVAEVGTTPDLNSLLLEWFGSESPSLEFRYVPVLRPDDILAKSTAPQLLRIWLVLQSPMLARVYFAEATGQRFLVRDVSLRNGLDEFGRENIAQVVVTAASAFTQRGASSTVKEVVDTFQQPLKPKPAPTASTNESSIAPALKERRGDWFLRFGSLYELSLEQSDVMSHGPGLLVGAGQNWHGARWLYSLKGQYRWPSMVQGAQVALEFHTLSVRALSAVELPLGNHWAAGLELGAAMDRVWFQAAVLPAAQVAARRAEVQYRPLVVTGVRGSLAAQAWHFTLVLGITAALTKTHFDVMSGAQSQTQYRPWLVQPCAALEASWR